VPGEIAMQRNVLQELFPAGRLPVLAAPMFLVSGPELAVACSQAGVIGSFPAPNARSVEILDLWLQQVTTALKDAPDAAPWALNMIVHSTYDRFERELALVMKYQPKVVTTALGSPKRVLEHVHSYGGVVMADVISPTLARKAVDAGVDALILVTHGAGGHTGTYNPFAFIAEVRKFWQGPLGLAGCISTGKDVRCAQLMGADFVVAGTRFIATEESLAAPAYRQLVVDSGIEDLVASKAVSGVMGNWFKATMDSAGIDPQADGKDKQIDFSGDISAGKKAWKDIWSAGQGVAAIERVTSARDVVTALRDEYFQVLLKEQDFLSHALNHGAIA